MDCVVPVIGADGESVGLLVVKLLFSASVLLTGPVVVDGFMVVAFFVVVFATEVVKCAVVDGGEVGKLLVEWLLLEFELVVTFM